MKVTRIDDARPYEAPGHFDMLGLRLQGKEASPSEVLTLGLSHFLPGGGASESASALERIYIVVEGEMTVTVAGEEVVLAALDSVLILAGEPRALVNRTNRPAAMLVVMPTA